MDVKQHLVKNDAWCSIGAQSLKMTKGRDVLFIRITGCEDTYLKGPHFFCKSIECRMSLFAIKSCQLEEIDHLMTLSKETYYQAIKAFNTRENMDHYVIKLFSKEQLLAEMRDQ